MFGLSLLPVELASLIIETLLTGVSLVVSCAAIYILCFKRGLFYRPASRSSRAPAPFSRTLFFVVLALMLEVIVHWILSVSVAFDAFIDQPDNLDALTVYEKIYGWKYLAKTALYLVEALVADCVLIYRLFVIWNSNKYIIILPCFSWVAAAVFGTGATYITSQPEIMTFTTASSLWIVGVFASVLTTNIYCSSLIAYRIWDSKRELKKLNSGLQFKSLKSSIEIVIESALVYTCTVLSTMILDLADSVVFFLTIDATSPLICIVFSLIIVRVELGISHRGFTTDIAIESQSPAHITTIGGTRPSFPGLWRVKAGPVREREQGRDDIDSVSDTFSLNFRHHVVDINEHTDVEYEDGSRHSFHSGTRKTRQG